MKTVTMKMTIWTVISEEGGEKKDKEKGKGKGKNKRKELPKEIAKKLERGGMLPPGIAKRDLPGNLEHQLPLPPNGVL